MQSRTVAALALVLVVTGLSGCGSEEPEPPTMAGLSVAHFDGGVPGLGDAALLTGAVRDDAGCFTVSDPQTGLTYTPVFPTSMVSPPSLSLEVGDDVSIRGGALEAPPAGATIPEPCAVDNPFWLVVDGE